MKRIYIFFFVLFALLLLAACNIVDEHVHTEVVDAGIPATCTQSGVSDGKHCTACGEITVAQVTLPALGHTEVIDAAVDATCTQSGLTEGKHCSACGEVLLSQESIPVLAHTVVMDPAVYATCTTPGLTAGTHCSACGEILIVPEQTPIVECRYDWRTDKAPTPTEEGLQSYACVMCGTVQKNQSIPYGTQNLKYGQYEDGTYYVKEVGYNISDREIVIPKTYNGQLVTGIGSKVMQSDASSIVIHQYITHIAEDAFISEPFTYKLSNITVDPNNPVYASIDGNLYTKDGKTLLRYAPAKKEDTFTLPDGVSAIGINAFAGATALVHVTLPAGVESIGEDAFDDCRSLAQIELPGSLTEIGQGAFSNCYALKTVELPDGVTKIAPYAFQYCTALTEISLSKCITEVPNGLFFGCENLTSVVLPEGITSIGDSAFLSCYSLKNIELPASLISIGECAFWKCSSISSVTFHANVTQLGDYAFAQCHALKSFEVDAENLVFSSMEGDLYDKEGKTLICYAIGKKKTSFTVPEGVETIAPYAFAYCDKLKRVVISDSVTSIGKNAFERCDSLESVKVGNGVTQIPDKAFNFCDVLAQVTLPAGLTSIGEYAFNWCDLTKIQFGGTVAQWEAVEKKPHYDDMSKTYVIHCTDGSVTRDPGI